MNAEPTIPNGDGTHDEGKKEVTEVIEVKGESEDVEMKDAVTEGASEVIYINNLNEKIKLDGKLARQSFFKKTACSRVVAERIMHHE